jgi:signal transduction histidine kinase/ligand-binding sensor domain-containing protein
VTPRVRPVLLALVLVLHPRRAPAQSAELPLAHWQHTAWIGDSSLPPLAGEGMVPSNDGFLWLGAPRGLVRFDGARFTLFDSTSVPALKGATGCCHVPMQLDSSGTMWVLGPDGLVLSYRDGKFRVEMPAGSGRDGLVMKDRLGRLWGSHGRLEIIRNGQWEKAPLPAGVPDTGMIGLEPDSGNGIWIGTRRQGIWHVNGDSVEHFGSGWLRPALQSSDGTVWTIGIRSPYLGVGRLKNGVWSPVTLPDSDVRPSARSVVEGPDGSVWIPTNLDGVLRWRHGMMEQFSAANGLSSDNTTSLYVGVEGTVWVVTDAGLDRLRPAELAYAAPSDMATPVSFTGIDRRGAAWSTGESAVLIRLSGGLIQHEPGPIKADSLPMPGKGQANVFASSREGGVWLAPLDGGVIHVGERGVRSYGKASGLPSERVLKGLEARDGALWLDLFGKGFGRLRDGRYRPFSLPDSELTDTFAEDSLGRVWIGEADRPVLFAVSRDSIVARVELPAGKDTHPVAITPEGGDTLWVATDDALYRIAGERAAQVPVPSLARIFAGGVSLGVSRGQLWLASPSGIARVALHDLHRSADGDSAAVTPVIFDALDGIPTPRTPGPLRNTIQVGPDGRVWILTRGGLAVADGPRVPHNPVAPTIRIESVTLGDSAIALTDGASLRPHPHELAIRFVVPDLGIAERMRVEYQLEGSGQDWVTATPPYMATYDQLRPGRYHFRVRAWNEAGVAGLAEATLAFRVLAGWEESWWFRALGVLAAAGAGAVIAVAIHRNRTRRAVALAGARFDAMLAERTRLARELHDTLLQGFTGITLQLDGVRSSLAESSAPLAEDLSTILQGADRTLRDAREMVWDMRQPGLADADLGAALQAASAALPNPDGIVIEHRVTGTPRPLSPAVATACLRIGKEAMVNALAHSKAATIAVSLDYETHHVRLEVRDDGCGATPEQLEVAAARGHWGIAGMRERARTAGGTLTVDTTPGRGTRVVMVVAG